MKKFNFSLLIVFIATMAFGKNDANDCMTPLQFESSVTTLDYYEPGTTMDINFVLQFQTSDYEYGDYISLTFPDGITPIGSPTDPFAPVNEGQGEEYLNGVSGQTISWGSNNNDQWGGIEIGTHNFIVTVTVDESVSGPQVVDVVVQVLGTVQLKMMNLPLVRFNNHQQVQI